MSSFERAFYERFGQLPEKEDDRKSMPMIYFQRQVKKRELRKKRLDAAQLLQRWFRGTRVRQLYNSSLTKQRKGKCCLLPPSWTDVSSHDDASTGLRCRSPNHAGKPVKVEAFLSGGRVQNRCDGDTFGCKNSPASTIASTRTEEVRLIHEIVEKKKHQPWPGQDTSFSGQTFKFSSLSTETSYFSAESRKLDLSVPSLIMRSPDKRETGGTSTVSQDQLDFLYFLSLQSPVHNRTFDMTDMAVCFEE